MPRSFLIISLLLLSSCATLLNQKTIKVKVITSKPGQIVVQEDTIHSIATGNFIGVVRQKAPLKITAISDSISKTVLVKSRNSFAYWLNLYPYWNLWTGFLIDRKNPKRYTYPRTIFIDMSKRDSSYLRYKPMAHLPEQKNILKLTPLKTLDFANPAIELSYERLLSKRFSTQLSASYLLPSLLLQLGTDSPMHTKGFKVGIEGKLYFQDSGPIGPYASLEFNYLQTQYNYTNQFEITDPTMEINYTDRYTIRKTIYTYALKGGYQVYLKRFVLDFYAGIGIRYRDVIHSDRFNLNDKMKSPRHPNIYFITNEPGKYWTVAIPINLKIGYAF